MVSCLELLQVLGGTLKSAMVVVHDYQSLIAGCFAILAAWIAARPVWRQLHDTSLQSSIAQRETLIRIKAEAEERFDKVDAQLLPPLRLLSDLTHDPIGGMVEIGAHDAFGVEQQLDGALDWYLVTLRGTESRKIENAKAKLKKSLGELLTALSDVHWIEHNEQHDEERSISDEGWAELEQRHQDAPALVHDLGSSVHLAANELRAAQQEWLNTMRSLIAKLEHSIVMETS